MMQKKIISIFVETTITLIVVFMLLEITLRVFPSLIPLSLLVEFQNDLRREIAVQRGLPAEENFILIERDDGGPPVRIPRPFLKITHPERDPGAIEAVEMDQRGFLQYSKK